MAGGSFAHGKPLAGASPVVIPHFLDRSGNNVSSAISYHCPIAGFPDNAGIRVEIARAHVDDCYADGGDDVDDDG